MNKKELPELLELAQTLLGQWIRYRQYFDKGMSGEAVSQEEEAEFLQTASAIVQNARKLGAKLDEKQFPIRKDQIAHQLKGAISVAYFRDIPQADQNTFRREWHTTLIYLSRVVGALKFLQEGYTPASLMKKKKGKKKGAGAPVVPIIAVVIVIAVVGGVLWYLGYF